MAPHKTTSSRVALRASGVDLHVEWTGSGVRAGLTDALREAVRSGRLAPGSRLPASRALAEDLGIARSTVTECYATLIEEGWLTARHGSGTRVAERAQPLRKTPTAAPSPEHHSNHGLGPGAADYADFPRAAWLSAARRAFSAAPHSAFGYGDPLGRMELRTALADYLSRVRGVYADPSRIVVCSGYHHGLSVITRALKAQGTNTVGVESYGLDIYREVLSDEGMITTPIEVDEDGAVTTGLDALPPAAALSLTPAHQFPSGYALTAERRSALLDWARSTGGVLLEDDYDGEFRYDRRPVGALQGLDPDHVVYFGTASKSIAPALRLAWMVVPERLLPAVAHAKGRVDTVSVLDQLIFTEFVTSGALDRHIRSRRHSYRKRREDLADAIAAHPGRAELIGMPAGLQAVVLLPAGSEPRVLRAAAQQGLTVSGLAEFRHPQAAIPGPWGDGLVVNFSAVSDAAWPTALRSLVRVLP
ncbi:MocR-like pyridoxine biosynthesis transcription factor PdxR [Microbacterium saperdae]